MSIRPVIHWFRRDLRLRDNLALHAAVESKVPVMPLFIYDPVILNSDRVGAPRLAFWINALEALDKSLKEYSTWLLVRQGKPLDVLQELVKETKARALYFNRDYSPYARKRDKQIAAALDIEVCDFDDNLLVTPDNIKTGKGDPYTVYTPFMKKWKKKTKPGISECDFEATHFYGLQGLRNDGIDAIEKPETIDLPEASEAAAQKRLDDFLNDGIHAYREHRNFLPIQPFQDNAPDGSSYLSPYLRAGIISSRTVYDAARAAYAATDSTRAKKSIETFVNELIWREFYMHVMVHFPHVLAHDFRDTYANLAWKSDEEALDAWKTGQTGYPIVDASMRQMNAIGWMPNRARMIVASFLTKDLLIHWREGDVYFMQKLIDGDPAANNGGWQWAAGTGTDAQPYFRIFNPISQSKKFATPKYLRHWLPELEAVPDKHIHAPWEMDEPPKGYPAPIVDHAKARKETIAAFKKARGDDDA